MGLAGSLRDAYGASPEWLRAAVGRPFGLLPPGLRYGRAYRAAWRDAEEFSSGDRVLVERRKVEKLRDYLVWAGQSVPYYRSLFNELSFVPAEIESTTDVEVLPVLTKPMVRDLGDALKPDNEVVSGRMTSTGGTSGSPLSFAVSHEASAAEWAFVSHLWSMCGYGPRSRRAVLRGQLVPGRTSGSVYWHDPINHALILSASDLSPDTASLYVHALSRFRPDFLHAYPSTASTLARLVGRDALRLLRLKAILLSSENVYETDRELLSDSFGAPVVSLYGLSEKVAMACQCQVQESFHVAEGHSLIELVDSQGAVIHEAGMRGTIVGTGWLNRSTALIRYSTGDEAEYSDGTCSCGRSGRLLARLCGHRLLEVLYAADGSAIPATAFLHAVHDPVFALAMRFQFVQTIPGHATLIVVPKAGAHDGVAESLRAVFAKRLANRVSLDVKIADDIQPEASGKFRYVVSSTPIDSAGASS